MQSAPFSAEWQSSSLQTRALRRGARPVQGGRTGRDPRSGAPRFPGKALPGAHASACRNPPQAIAHPAASSEAPASGWGAGRWEAGAAPPAGSSRRLAVSPWLRGAPCRQAPQRSGHGRLERWQPGRPGTEGRPARAPRTVRTGGRPRGRALGAQARAQPAAAAGAAAAMSARPRCRSPAVMSSAESPPRRPTPAPRGPPRPCPAPRAPGFGDAEAGGGCGTMRRARVAALAAVLPLPARRVSGGAAPGGCARVGAGAPREGGVGYPRPSPCQVAVC